MSNSKTPQQTVSDSYLRKDEGPISISVTDHSHTTLPLEDVVPNRDSSDMIQSTSKQYNKKPKRWTWKKIKGKPSRPMSAYNFFFKCERARILSQHNNKSGGFGQLAKVISQKWNVLSNEDRIIYQQQAEHEKCKYHIALREWEIQNYHHMNKQNQVSTEVDTFLGSGGHMTSSIKDIGENIPENHSEEKYYSVPSFAISPCCIERSLSHTILNNDSYSEVEQFQQHNDDDILPFDFYNNIHNYKESQRKFSSPSMVLEKETSNTSSHFYDDSEGGISDSTRSVTPFDPNDDEYLFVESNHPFDSMTTTNLYNNNHSYNMNEFHHVEKSSPFLPMNQSNMEINDEIFHSSVNSYMDSMCTNTYVPNLTTSGICMNECISNNTNEELRIISNKINSTTYHRQDNLRTYHHPFCTTTNYSVTTLHVSKTSIEQLSAAFDDEALEILRNSL